MKDEHGAQRACENKKPLIDGRRANVQLAYLGAKKKTKDGISFFKTLLALSVAIQGDFKPVKTLYKLAGTRSEEFECH